MIFEQRSNKAGEQKKSMDETTEKTKPGSTLTSPSDELSVNPSAVPDSVGEEEFLAAYGESIAQTLDIDTWERGEDLAKNLERLDQEVAQALQQEEVIRKKVREIVFPQILARPNAPKQAGVIQATTRELRTTQINVLFNGAVEACDGTCVVHDTLPLSIAQIGVCTTYRC